MYAGYVCACRMRDNTHRTQQKERVVVFVMCILGAAHTSVRMEEEPLGLNF